MIQQNIYSAKWQKKCENCVAAISCRKKPRKKTHNIMGEGGGKFSAWDEITKLISEQTKATSMVKAFLCRKLIIIRQAANEGIIYERDREGEGEKQFIINLVTTITTLDFNEKVSVALNKFVCYLFISCHPLRPLMVDKRDDIEMKNGKSLLGCSLLRYHLLSCPLERSFVIVFTVILPWIITENDF